MLIAVIILAVVCVAAATCCAWLLSEKRSYQLNQGALRGQLHDLDQQKLTLDTQVNSLQIELAESKKDYQNLQNQSAKAIEQFEKAQQMAQDRFQTIADKVLKTSNDQFLQLARQNFDGNQKQANAELEKKQQSIKALVDPIKESLNKYNQTVQQIETARKEAYGSLTQRIKGLHQAQQDLSKETRHLGQALRRPEVRGRWGEMQLKRVAELAGMIENCDFYEQQTVEDGSARPDMVVNLPGDRCIVVDSKTNFDAFAKAIESEDEADRQQLFTRHAKQIEEQVRSLASKNYPSKIKGRSPDFVVLFIPSESLLDAALRREPDLIDKAMQANVVIATPTTLISLLKAVAAGWREQQIAENAQRISALGQELHKRLCTAVSHLDNLGKAVGKTVEHYNKFLGSMESQVLSQARRFEQLGSDSHKQLPNQLNTIDTIPREITSR